MTKIVVGVDGSPGGLAALAWAYDEAAVRAAPLHLVHCWEYPYLGTMDVVGLDDGVRNEVETSAQALLDEAVASVAAAHPGGPVAVTGELVRGEAGPTLLRAAEGSAMLVVGARGRRGLMALLLGSVSTNVVSHATVPVVVVPAPAATDAN